MHTRSTYLQIKPGREAILKNTRNNAKLQKDYEGNSLSCAFMLPILWAYLIKIIYYILDTVSGSKDTEKINKLFFVFFTLESLDSCHIEIVLKVVSKICLRTAIYQAVFVSCTLHLDIYLFKFTH